MKKHDDAYIGMVKLGPKGQIVIPKEVRDIFGIGPGDSLMILAEKKRGIALQRPSLLSKVAEAVLSGQRDSFYVEDTEEDVKGFANLVSEIVDDEEDE